MNIGDLPAQLFSPAKIAYIAYVVFVGLGKLSTSLMEFLVVTVLFLMIEVFHNDFLRIWLNARAERGSRSRAATHN
jgi:hypothetical protein